MESSSATIAAASKLHNELAEPIVKLIVKPMVAAGGDYQDVMVLTESILVGVVLSCIPPGADENVIDAMMSRAKERISEIRLRNFEVSGEA